MGTSTDNPWLEIFLAATSLADIRQRAYIPGHPIPGLDSALVEVACTRLEKALKSVFYPTTTCCEIIRDEIEKAIGFCEVAYPSKKQMIGRVYAPPKVREPYLPTCITGLAGTGKSAIEDAYPRVLGAAAEILVAPDHTPFPHLPTASVRLTGTSTVIRCMLPLSNPENGKVAEAVIADECANWLYRNGTCLFGVDELQFMTQSPNASTLVSKVLLKFSHIGVPWHFTANYSLCWKLKRRPQETTQRLLSRPVVLFPDPPNSDDWMGVLSEYSKVLSAYFDFLIQERAVDLWNLCAGLKRELINLLINAYRLRRYRKAPKVQWADVLAAYASIAYSTSREQVEKLIAFAAQGGELSEDLRCPFSGGSIDIAARSYADKLRGARALTVAAAARDASLSVSERATLNTIETATGAKKTNKKADVLPLPSKSKQTLASLQEAGRRFRTKHDEETKD